METYGLPFIGSILKASRGAELHLVMLRRLCRTRVGPGHGLLQLFAVDEGSGCSFQLPLVASAYEGPNNILNEGILRGKSPTRLTPVCVLNHF